MQRQTRRTLAAFVLAAASHVAFFATLNMIGRGPDASRAVAVLLAWLPEAIVTTASAYVGYGLPGNALLIRLVVFGLVFACFLGFFNYLWALAGYPADFTGAKASAILAALAAPWQVAVSLAGGVVGHSLRAKSET